MDMHAEHRPALDYGWAWRWDTGGVSHLRRRLLMGTTSPTALGVLLAAWAATGVMHRRSAMRRSPDGRWRFVGRAFMIEPMLVAIGSDRIDLSRSSARALDNRWTRVTTEAGEVWAFQRTDGRLTALGTAG